MAPGPRSGGQAGFTLVEMAISMVLLLLALTLAAQILLETTQLFAETSGESLDTPVPLVIARIRGDVQGSLGASLVLGADGKLDTLVLEAPGKRILYQKQGNALYRTVVPLNGDPPGKPAPLWRDVTRWGCQILGPNLVSLEVAYRRRAVPRSPLATLPAFRAPVNEELTQRMYFLSRGAGLGDTW